MSKLKLFMGIVFHLVLEESFVGISICMVSILLVLVPSNWGLGTPIFVCVQRLCLPTTTTLQDPQYKLSLSQKILVTTQDSTPGKYFPA